MSPRPKKYWVFSHDTKSTMLHDILESDNFQTCIEAVCNYLDQYVIDDQTVRIVDNTTKSTVWIAGPVIN